tara:strand:- start:3008 stop:3436 length:429 start_codon:yes stop_codon:yes gene_type:complete
MPDITMQFARQVYPSLQIGDKAYYAIIKTSDDDDSVLDDIKGFNINDPSEDYVEIGSITAITEAFLEDGVTPTTSITINANSSVEPPTTQNYIFFKKKFSNSGYDPNMSSLLGYFGSAKFENNSEEKAELYATSCEISESSK